MPPTMPPSLVEDRAHSGRRSYELRGEHERIYDRMQGIIDAAEKVGAELTHSQQRDWDDGQKELDRLRREIKTAEERELAERLRVAGQVGGGEFPEDLESRALRSDQSMVQWGREHGEFTEESEHLSLGKYVRGMVLGDWRGADMERRAMGESTGGAGGYMVPSPLSAMIIDKARNQTRVLQAGARVIPMDAQTLKVARWSGDPTPTWYSENAVQAASDATLQLVTFTAQTLRGHTLISREVLEDAANLDAVLVNALGRVAAIELDRAALRGSGTPPEPRGVLNQSGISTTTIGAGNGLSPTYDDIITSGLAPIQDANFEPNAYIGAPRLGRTYSKLKDSQGRYLDPPTDVRPLTYYGTNQVPINLTVGTSTDCSEIYVADWSQLAIGMRTQFELLLLRERWADYGQMGFMVWMRADVQLLQPTAFAVIKGVRG